MIEHNEAVVHGRLTAPAIRSRRGHGSCRCTVGDHLAELLYSTTLSSSNLQPRPPGPRAPPTRRPPPTSSPSAAGLRHGHPVPVRLCLRLGLGLLLAHAGLVPGGGLGRRGDAASATRSRAPRTTAAKRGNGERAAGRERERERRGVV